MTSSDTALVDGISRALGVPHPFVHEPNPAFTLVEDWQQLACLVATEPISVKPVGYYRSPESVDIYVFECSMGTGGDAKTWKIYRRYRQFQQYVARSSELLAAMAVPRLSQAYLKIFYAKQCKDRLVELHAWLAGVIDNTQRFCQTQAQTQAQSSQTQTQTPPADTRAWLLEQLRSESPAAMPALWLSTFVLAGSNTPFPHVFRGLPAFALALEEINVELTHAPMLPSKLRSSIETHAGLGLRLTPSREQRGAYTGVTVSGFLRDAAELDANLANVPVGAKLVRINGVDVTDEPFDAVLGRLRSVGLPLRLRFVYNPHGHRRARVSSGRVSRDAETEDGGGDGLRRCSVDAVGASASPNALRARRSLSSAASTTSDTSNSVQELPVRTRSSVAPPARAPSSSTGTGSSMDALTRRYSMDSRKSLGIFSAVFGDLFGRSSSRPRHDTADAALLFASHAVALASWDDVGGTSRDVVSRGFFSLLSPALRLALRQREQLQYDDSALLGRGKHSPNSSGDDPAADGRSSSIAMSAAAEKALSERRAQGVWSTSTGPLGLSLGACKLQGVEAAMLELPPQFFSARLGCVGSEKHLAKGFVLVSINNESTFGLKFAAVMRQLAKAARPTAVCFRWFQDYSPFLETDWAERSDPAAASHSSSKLPPPHSGSTWHDDSSPLKREPLAHQQPFVHPLECLAEAQADLCSHLHLALVENASIRNEVGALQDAQRRDAAARAQSAAQTQRIAQLELELATRDAELRDARQQCAALEAQCQAAERSCQTRLDAAHAAAKRAIADHEARLVRESNRSIATARGIAERQFRSERDAALTEAQRRHDAYLQQLAEEHAEEVESLAQQVVVWRHQVEVLTEAEKRNYAALVRSGVQPYQDPHRSRFGLGDTSSSSPWGADRSDGVGSGVAGSGLRTAGSKGFGDRTLGATSKGVGYSTTQQQQQQMAYESWRDGTPEDPRDHAFSDVSDPASPSVVGASSSSSAAGGGTSTFWSAWFGS